MRSREELAWAAGLFDGEGTVGAYLNPRSKALQFKASVAQVDRKVLDRFQIALGMGRVVLRLRKKLRGNERPIFEWVVQSFEETQASLVMLWTWLSPVKREQFKLAQARFLAQAHIVDPGITTRRRSRSLQGNQNAKGKKWTWTQTARKNHMDAITRRGLA